MTQTLGRVRGLLAGFTPGQKAVVAVAVIGLVMGAVALTRYMSQPEWTPLYGNLAGEDANSIVEELKTQGVPYQLADGGRTVLVPQAQVYDLRVAMSGKGLPAGDSEGGYSLLDQQGITATDFQQNVAYRRALEGELNKTLMAMDGVKTAVVHLALPKKDIFSEEQDKPTASVLLALRPGVELDRGQVRAITQLVAGSVESLEPANVTVTDSNGRLLSTSDTETGGSADAANEADEQTAKYEDRMSTAVQKVLDQVVGTGRSVVRVNAELDFDSEDTTTERYLEEEGIDPISESTTTEEYEGSGGATGGVLGSTTPELVAGNEGNNSYKKTERTVNNSVGKEVQRVQKAPGGVQRLTVAVVLDSKVAGAMDANQIEQLVGNAVGLNAERGDTVQVEALPFDTSAQDAAAAELAAADKAAAMERYVSLGKQAGLWLLGLLVLFILFRRRKKGGDITVEATATSLPLGSTVEGVEGVVIPAGAGAPIDGGLLTALPSGTTGREVLAGPDRDQMRDEVAALVDSQPDDVAAMLQGWLDERKA
jgi:flagellar M-ring protein FliF